MSIANVSIVGNLVKAPQQVQFESGKIKTTMVVAVNTPGREKRGGDKADFYLVETWGKLAELVAGRLDKGNQIAANGRLLISKWKDDKGQERTTPTISALDVAFPQRPKNGEYSAGFSASRPQVSLVSSAQPVAPEYEAPPENIVQAGSDDDSDSDEEFVESEQDDSSDYGLPNSATKPAPLRDGRKDPR